jgi:hypothetical protein
VSTLSLYLLSVFSVLGANQCQPGGLDGGKTEEGTVAGPSEWECEGCTFLNQSFSLACALCGQQVPASVQATNNQAADGTLVVKLVVCVRLTALADHFRAFCACAYPLCVLCSTLAWQEVELASTAARAARS